MKKIVLAFCLFASFVIADDKIDTVRNNLMNKFPEINTKSIVQTGVSNMYLLELQTGEILYTDGDINYFLDGNLYLNKNNKLSNFTSEYKAEITKSKVANVKNKITFSPDKKLASIIVFSDTTCGYCRKLHSEMDDLLARGIEINYLAFPRNGENSRGFEILEKVFCSSDRKQAITDAKKDIPLQVSKQASAKCTDIVKSHYNLGVELGATGTPFIVFENGTVMPGYQPSEILAELAIDNKN